MALKKYGFGVREGLYTNMNAIRKDEEVDNLHSYYVDQWDWERVIEKEDRNITTLKNHVKKIFKVIKHMEHEVWLNTLMLLIVYQIVSISLLHKN